MPETLLRAENVGFAHGARTVLGSIDITLNTRSRLAITGPNGSGKTTLLRILAGELRPDSGLIARIGRVGYLPQLASNRADPLSARERILAQAGLTEASRELDRLTAALSNGRTELIDAHAAALTRWLALGGDDAGARADTAAADIGLDPELLERPMASLSGGQAARVGLAALEVTRFDVVLLDEPTNHLDADGLARLHELVAARDGAVALVSHDRPTLAELASEVLELDPGDGSCHLYSGGWDAFERERRIGRERARSAYEDAAAERRRIAGIETEMRRRAAASARRVSGSGGADGDKHVKEWVRARADGAARRARRVGTRIERLEMPEAPREARPLRLELDAAERRDGWALRISGLVLGRGEWRLGPLELAVRYGDRIRLAGPNGSGKSTLIGAIAGEIAPLAGSIDRSASATIGTLGQGREGLDPGLPVAESVRRLTGLGVTEARTALAGFGLGAEAVTRPAGSLSPGERTRAELTLLAHAGANCLLLDEPGNHLDIESLELIEAGLEGWPGAVVLATHDERLAAALGAEQALELERVAGSAGPSAREVASDTVHSGPADPRPATMKERS